MSRNRIFQATLLLLIAGIVAFPFVLRVLVRNRFESHIYEVADAPYKPVAIVFGAAVYRGGRLSTVLRDRMDTAIKLYNNGVVDKIIVSGNQGEGGYDEPGAMLSYAIALGVPPSDLISDNQGDRTYDTCYRANHVFDQASVLLVTQEFHLPRALFTCSNLGIEVVGVKADQRTYRGARWYELRETAAMLVALADILWQKPQVSLSTTALID
jgi:SanA protein